MMPKIPKKFFLQILEKNNFENIIFWKKKKNILFHIIL